MIQCPECDSSKLALSGYDAEGININPSLCLNCGYVFYIEKGKIKDDPDGNLNRLLENMRSLKNMGKAIYVLRAITGVSKKEAKEYIQGL